MSYVNKSLQKKDAMALVTGKPVYTDDLAPKDCLIIKILRSPYANAWVEEIKTDTAMKVEGMALILTWQGSFQSTRDRMYPYMEGCSAEAFYHGRTDLSGVQSL